MIPILDKHGNQERDENGQLKWKRTVADDRLGKYSKVFGFSIEGRWFPLYSYIEGYERILGEEGRIIPFEMNESQVVLYEQMALMKLEIGYVRINDAKARQLGGSTLISGMFFALTAFNPGMSCGIIADTEAHGQELLRKYRLFYETTPIFIKSRLKLETDNANAMVINHGDGLKSSFRVVVAGDKAGRSAHYNMLHESEVATWQDIMATVGALDATVSDEDPNSIIVRETTAQGVNEWKLLFDKGVARRGSYRSVFIPWYVKSGYKHKWREHQLNEKERKLRDEFHLSKEQIQWWFDKWQDYNEDDTIMGKEFPTTASEMFLNSGSSFFNSKSVGIRKDELMQTKPLHTLNFEYVLRHSEDGQVYSMSDIIGYESRTGGCVIFEEPLKGHPYIINVDPSKGGEDYYCAIVLDNHTGKQVAKFAKQGKVMDADECLNQVYCLLKYYECGGIDAQGNLKGDMSNRVLFCYENNIDLMIGKTMEKLGVKEIYIDQAADTFSERVSDKYGYRTTAVNRTNILNRFQEMFRDNRFMVMDYDLICEMEAFQYQRSGRSFESKAMAMSGFHDDHVMAMAGACYVRSSFTTAISDEAPKAKRKGFDPMSSAKKGDPFAKAYMIW